MSFTTDTNGLTRYSGTITGDAGQALDDNAGTISAAITALNAAIASAQALITSLTTTVSGKAAKASPANDGHLAALDSSGNVTDSGATTSSFDTAGAASLAQTTVQANLNAHTADQAAHGATSANTASKIVARDGSGSINIGSANLSGILGILATSPIASLDVRTVLNGNACLLSNFGGASYVRAGTITSDLHLGDILTRNVLLGELGGVNVGIGTTNPSSRLDVAGDIAATSGTFSALNVGGGLFLVDVGGNVNANAYSVEGIAGASGTFGTTDGVNAWNITVNNGIIVSIASA